MANNYTVNERDVKFVLYEHCRVQDLCVFEKFNEFSQEDFEMIRKEAYKLARNELAPLHESSDREGLRFEDGKVFVPESFHEAFKKYSEGGWISVSRNPEYGGGGLPTVQRMMALEFFMGSCVAFTVYPGLAHGVGHLIESFGDPHMKEQFIQKLYSGQWLGTMCLTETQAGSALGEINTTAVPQNEDREYKIKGTKQFISSGEHDLTPNIIHMVLARIQGAPEGVRGISLFMVPKIRVNDDGSMGEPNDVACTAIEHKMGLHGSSTCQMAFGENDDCIGILVGEPNMGLIHMFQMMNEARISVGIQSLGQAAAAYEHALSYAKERVQGPSVEDRKGPPVPIINHPDVKRMLMTMKSTVEGLRALLYISGIYYDQSKHNPDDDKKEYYGNLLDILTPLCKAYASDKGMEICNLGMQVLGGYGYTRDYPLEQFYRDSWITSIYEGTNRIQSFDLLGRKVYMKQGEVWQTLVKEIKGFIEDNKLDGQIGKQVDELRRTLDQLQKVAEFLEPKREGDPAYFQLASYPFLQSTGDLVVSWLLLQQATIAGKELNQGSRDQDFYRAKTVSAKFFASENLPLARARCQAIVSQQQDVLDIPLESW